MIMGALSSLNFFLIGIGAFGVTYLLIPTVRQFAIRRDWLDQPDGKRKIHTESTPRSGGLAIWFGMMGGLFIALFLLLFFKAEGLGMDGGLSPMTNILLFVGTTVAAFTGLYDDVFQIKARMKLAAQVVAALPVLLCPELIEAVTWMLGGGALAEWAAYPLLLLWVLFFMNALNLIDGLDGLAGGVGLVALIFMVAVGGFTGSLFIISIALGGALLAFLRYNFPPASVFMGDMGSLLIGYLLAVLSLSALSMEPSVPRLLALIVLLGVPALDTVMAFFRRAMLGLDPMAPDSDHLHHRVLVRVLGNQKRAVTSLYGFAVGLGLVALVIATSPIAVALLFFGAVLGIGGFLIWDLGYFNRASYVKKEGRWEKGEKALKVDASSKKATQPAAAELSAFGPQVDETVEEQVYVFAESI